MIDDIRFANIGIAVTLVIAVAGSLVFHRTEAAMQASALVGIFVGLAVTLILLERAHPRKGKGRQ
jgi:hypothetical protein